MSAGDGLSSAIDNLKGWVAQPFNTQMSLSHWFLFTGLVLVAVVLWIMILHELKGELA